MQMNTPENQNAIFRMLVHEIQRLESVPAAVDRFEWTMEPDAGARGWQPMCGDATDFLRRISDSDYHFRHVEYGDGPIPEEASEGTPTPAGYAGLRVGDYVTVIRSSGDADTEDLPEGTRLKLDYDDGTTMPSFEDPATGDCYWVDLASVRREDSPAEGNRPWQVGDRAVITGPGGGHFFRVGEVVHLAKHEPDGIHYWRSARTGDRWAVPPSCVRREEAPEASCVVEAGDNTFWQVGDRFKIIDTDGGHGFDHGEVVELVTRDEGSGLSIHDYRSVTTGSIAGVADYRLQRLEDTTLWQVGDRFEVMDSHGHPFHAGETVELTQQDDSSAEWRQGYRGYTVHWYRSETRGTPGAVKSHRLRKLEHETPDTPATRMGLRVGDRAEVLMSTGDSCALAGDHVEFISDDGTSFPYFRNLRTGEESILIRISRLRKLEPGEAAADPWPTAAEPEPAPGEVWYVSIPMAPDGVLVKMWVTSLTDRVATLTPAAWASIAGQYAPEYGAEPVPMERDRVRFVERVQCAAEGGG